MFHLLIALVSIFVCYKYGDWRNWKLYYPTILFFILSSSVCTLLTYNYPLWLYESSFLGHTFSDLLVSITVYPCTVVLFIGNFPQKSWEIVKHIIFYTLLYTGAEWVSVQIGYMTHYNKWNIWDSMIFNLIMFPFLILHYRKPLLAWSIALVAPHLLFLILGIPYSVIR